MKLYKIHFVLILTIPFFIHAQYLGGDGRGDVSTIITNVPLPVEEVPNYSLTKFELGQNYPNPFNPKTVISYQLSVTSNVTLKIYDVLGNEIATLVNDEKTPGTYEVEFNTNSHSGISSGEVRNLPSGVYLYRLQAENSVETKKMLLIK